MSTENPAPEKKIRDVEVRNYMRVRQARLTLDGNTFVISGANEQGKSSFVQAIEDAFGGSKFAPAMPIRKGASVAVILITLTDGTGRTLKAEIVHSKTGRRLTVKDADGKAQLSPQFIMDAFWAETSFDPSLFLISKPAEQTEMLKRLGGLDFTKLDKEREEKFTIRTATNKEADRLATLALSKLHYPAAPKEEISTQAVLDEIAIATKANPRGEFLWADVKTRQQRIATAKTTMEGLEADRKDIEQQIANLQAKLATVKGRITEGIAYIDTETAGLETSMKEHQSFKAIDLAPLQTKLAGVEEENKRVRANADKAAATEEARKKRAESDALTNRIDAIDETKAEMLRNTRFPIDGMSIDGDDVTIGGIPLAQQSDMRRLAIGVEMAAVMNPGKPLILVRHGNLFTPENFGILEEIAKRRNLTCIVEIPGKNVAGAKLVFEDGVGTEPGATTAEQPELPTA